MARQAMAACWRLISYKACATGQLDLARAATRTPPHCLTYPRSLAWDSLYSTRHASPAMQPPNFYRRRESSGGSYSVVIVAATSPDNIIVSAPFQRFHRALLAATGRAITRVDQAGRLHNKQAIVGCILWVCPNCP